MKNHALATIGTILKEVLFSMGAEDRGSLQFFSVRVVKLGGGGVEQENPLLNLLQVIFMPSKGF